MKRIVGVAGVIVLALAILAPAVYAQQEERGEFSVFADYTRLKNAGNANYWGPGGEVSFNLGRFVQLEGGMAYDLAQTVNFTGLDTGANSISTNANIARLRLLDGLFGPKFQTGIGPVKAFVTLKGGFLNFQFDRANTAVGTGFVNAVNNVPTGDTNGVFYPSAGVEFFMHHNIGFRAEVGDMMYFDNGANHNLKFNIGPVLRW